MKPSHKKTGIEPVFLWLQDALQAGGVLGQVLGHPFRQSAHAFVAFLPVVRALWSVKRWARSPGHPASTVHPLHSISAASAE
jgi:hypothetical protein